MRRIDFIPYNPTLSIEGYDGFKTIFGGILSIFVALSTILSIAAFSKDMIFKLNPSVISSEVYQENPSLQRSDLNIAFGIGLVGGVDFPDINRYLKFRFGIVDVDGSRINNTILYKFYNSTQCISTDLFKLNKFNITNNLSMFKQLYYCLPDTVSNYDIEGTYGNGKLIAYDIRLEYCSNQTLSSTDLPCVSMQQIQKFLPAFFINIVGNSYIFNPSNYDNPISPNLYSYTSRISALASRQITMYYKLIDFVSDEGFILESRQQQKSFFFDNLESDSVSDSNPAYILRTIITVKSVKVLILRTYTKIQKVASDVGGVIKFIMTVASFLNHLYGKSKFMSYIIRRIDSQLSYSPESLFFKTRQTNSVKFQSELEVKPSLIFKLNPEALENSNIGLEEPTRNKLLCKKNLILLSVIAKKSNFKLFEYLCFLLKVQPKTPKSRLEKVKKYLTSFFSLESIIDSISFSNNFLQNYSESKNKCPEVSVSDFLKNNLTKLESFL